jgi:acetoin utilization deacetylase AcuC-like enzyme
MAIVIYSKEQEKFVRPGHGGPERVERLVAALEEDGHRIVHEPGDYTIDRFLHVHDPELIELYQDIYLDYVRGSFEPERYERRLESMQEDRDSPFLPPTWAAVCSAVAVTVTGVSRLTESKDLVFCATRPAGHRAGRRFFGGGSYVNNAAIAASALLELGPVAVLDIGARHAVGTQDIFALENSVLTLSIHAAPDAARTGRRRYRGSGPGRGAHRNFVLEPGCGPSAYLRALRKALRLPRRKSCASLVLCFGSDIRGEGDLGFGLTDSDVRVIGAEIASLALPTIVLLEDGDNPELLAASARALLAGFESLKGTERS